MVASPAAASGFGVGMTDQREPSQRSARVAISRAKNGSGGPKDSPTAKHTRPSGQDTPVKVAPSAPSGFGAACSAHALIRPDQRSTSGSESRPFDTTTAVQVRFRGHETAPSQLGSELWAFGVDWTCQPVPSQRSASVPPFSFPTAVQARSPEQETAVEEGACDVRTRSIDQLVPFQRSMSGLRGEFWSMLQLPTAKQTFRRGQEMPLSELKVAPGDSGSARSASSRRPSVRPPSPW